ncbi:MAG: tRNA 2-selenouridine(34) synthase MnmH [SAR324 cluster bacterium]|nr:tRNA 2-selenouridine(34) synthase MnmH [SAR324 cluster bacterium]
MEKKIDDIIADREHFLSSKIPSVSITELDHDSIVIDVRTPEEYENGHIPGAINIPLFNDEQRSIIGKIYKHQGKKNAINQGYDYVEQNLNKFINQLVPYMNGKVVIYCARGGMRSGSVTHLLMKLGGSNVLQLVGGYKSYRQNVLHFFETFSIKCIVLNGRTGTGKTEIINQLDQSIDLEGLAQHRGSLFGFIGRKPRNQKTFEGLLYNEINKNFDHVFIEGESNKIGKVFIPKGLFEKMQKGVNILVTAPLELRVQRILNDYRFDDEEQYTQIYKVIQSLKISLGKKKVDYLCDCLANNNLPDLVRTLLIEYYDPLYDHKIDNKEYALEVCSSNIFEAKKSLEKFKFRLKNRNE